VKQKTTTARKNVQQRLVMLPAKIRAPLLVARKPLSFKFAIWSVLSSAVSIWSILFVTHWYGEPLLIGSFGASAVLLFSAPGGELSQPRNLVGGHVISAVIGVILVKLCGPTTLATGLAVGLAIGAMYLTHTLHPPGGATALIAVAGSAGWEFVIVPVLLGTIILLINAILVNNFVHHRKYPVVWF
jgi:CBS-domain-containing membrane protein